METGRDDAWEADGDHVVKLSMQKLSLAADYYANLCPALARFYTKEAQYTVQGFPGSQQVSLKACRCCGTVFRPGTYTLKSLPKLKATKKLQKLKDDRGRKHVGVLQRKLLAKLEANCSRTALICNRCNKRIVKVRVDTDYKLRKAAKKARLKQSAEAVPETQPLSNKQKKRQKKKERRHMTAHERAGLIPPASVTANAHRSKPTANGNDKETQKKLSTLPVSAHRSLKDILGASHSITQKLQQIQNTTKKKKMTAIEKLLSKEKEEKRDSRGGGLASFLSSL